VPPSANITNAAHIAHRQQELGIEPHRIHPPQQRLRRIAGREHAARRDLVTALERHARDAALLDPDAGHARAHPQLHAGAACRGLGGAQERAGAGAP
jgi:hypothetical protein